ncbi:MAG: enoyl-CoA hydratase/isomerase family protein [Phenylobacterium sp.]|jgi:enoyl-CoA hydratase/carnithine racemase|uniref:enoyl-CoA hydratase/isomerase family protein n=1 Tax=Phenylobacterium sp. TaxID=1871053 RepID=UPI001A1CC803|nr:enoyl-CoA hydratase/isomerase family protein [Phenylobacterium sp.]MBJ7412021.1 enoyl-CoA hydratase/isomerase family protein [Phenylobacterium sp.]
MKTAFGDHVKVALDGHVAVVTLDRPPHNFVSVEFMADLADAMEAADASNDVRAIVLQSEGRTFSGGADFASPTDKVASGMEGVNALYDQAVRLFSVQKPIVAAVQGSAVGAGLGLALVADFRIAAPEARFAANFVKLSFHPGFGLTHTLPRLVGQQRAALMFLTGRRIKAEEGLAWGLVDEVVPMAELREAALRLAREIAENAPLAVLATRKTLRSGLAAAVKAQTGVEHEEQALLRATEDFAEGVRSVAERRPGNFVGR